VLKNTKTPASWGLKIDYFTAALSAIKPDKI